MIPVVEYHFDIIFCFLTNRKCNFFQVDKSTMQVVEWHLKVIALDSLIFDLVRSRKRCFNRLPGPGNSFPSSCPAENVTLLKSRKPSFKDMHVTMNSFTAILPSHNASWLRSIKQCSKVSHGNLNYFRSLDLPEMRLGWSKKRYF